MVSLTASSPTSRPSSPMLTATSFRLRRRAAGGLRRTRKTQDGHQRLSTTALVLSAAHPRLHLLARSVRARRSRSILNFGRFKPVECSADELMLPTPCATRTSHIGKSLILRLISRTRRMRIRRCRRNSVYRTLASSRTRCRAANSTRSFRLKSTAAGVHRNVGLRVCDFVPTRWCSLRGSATLPTTQPSALPRLAHQPHLRGTNEINRMPSPAPDKSALAATRLLPAAQKLMERGAFALARRLDDAAGVHGGVEARGRREEGRAVDAGHRRATTCPPSPTSRRF